MFEGLDASRQAGPCTFIIWNEREIGNALPFGVVSLFHSVSHVALPSN